MPGKHIAWYALLAAGTAALTATGVLLGLSALYRDDPVRISKDTSEKQFKGIAAAGGVIPDHLIEGTAYLLRAARFYDEEGKPHA